LTEFVVGLSAANAGVGSRQSGWIVQSLSGNSLVVERGGLAVWISRDDTLCARSESIDVGTAVEVRLPKELLRVSPGHYMALGDGELDLSSTIVRIYWNLRAEGAAQFVGRATGLLNGSQVPFRLKVLNEPDFYHRCDAGVLYIHRTDYSRAAPTLTTVYRDLRSMLDPTTPPFTKRLAPGLAVAEEPATVGESFGTHRCRLVADALIAAYEETCNDLRARRDAVAQRFSDEGLRLAEPHLNPGSVDIYQFSA
jgi:hypothetical protein